MKNSFIFSLLILFSIQSVSAESNIKTMTVYEGGAARTIEYDNTYPQCLTYSSFIVNTSSYYKTAYRGNYSLKKADENTSNSALRSIQTIVDEGLPLPFSYQSLMKEADLIKTQIFNKKEISPNFMNIHKECSEKLSKNPLMNNSNYGKAIDYSKGEHKAPK